MLGVLYNFGTHCLVYWPRQPSPFSVVSNELSFTEETPVSPQSRLFHSTPFHIFLSLFLQFPRPLDSPGLIFCCFSVLAVPSCRQQVRKVLSFLLLLHLSKVNVSTKSHLCKGLLITLLEPLDLLVPSVTQPYSYCAFP